MIDERQLLPARTTGRFFSFGGGVQSTAVMVLQARGELPAPYDAFIFSNVGVDSESPHTLKYIEEVSRPYCKEHGIPFIEVAHHRETLVEHIYRTKRSVPIPVRMSNGAPGNRSCTADFKVRVVNRWLKEGGYERVVVGLGISLDEFRRMRDTLWHDGYGSRSYGFWQRRDYPLIDMRLRRKDCREIIVSAGLPLAPKSSCFFCPFKKRGEWIEMRRREPELFARAAEIEDHVNEKRGSLGRDRVYLHSSAKPLREAVGLQGPLFPDEDLDQCDSGFCFT